MTILSNTQRQVVSYFKQGYNLQIEAVAGAGKSTTLLEVAKSAKEDFGARVLVLTYNRSLCDDLKNKILKYGLEDYCFPFTYHKYAKEIYKTRVSNDQELYNCLQQRPKFNNHVKIVLVDEVQDMKPEYYKLLTLILQHGSLLVLVGDRRQCIYGSSSAEYLVNYKKYFDTGRPWKEIKMNVSYRTTYAIACFVNTHLIGDEVVIPGNYRNINLLPIYYYNVWDIGKLVSMMVRTYGPNEVAIIVPSTKPSRNHKTPLGKLIGEYREGLLFYIKDSSNQEKTNSLTINNKVLITTYHSMKGLERNCVIVLGFDRSYMKYYDRGSPRLNPDLPNILYVAATRARQQLILVQGGKCAPLKTIKGELLELTCDVRGKETLPDDVDDTPVTIVSSVTDTLSYLPTETVISLLNLIKSKQLNEYSQPLQYEKVIKFGNYYEDVSNYYGILIPLYLQYKLHGKIHWGKITDIRPQFCDICTRYNYLLSKDKTLNEWMELVVLRFAYDHNRHFCVDQIKHYNWVDTSYIIECVNRLFNRVPASGKFERGCVGIPRKQCDEIAYDNRLCKFYWVECSDNSVPSSLELIKEQNYNIVSRESPKLHGVFDYLTDYYIWEFKCVSEISDNNKLQLATYIALYYKETGNNLKGRLLNARTNDDILLELDDPDTFLSIISHHQNLSHNNSLISSNDNSSHNECKTYSSDNNFSDSSSLENESSNIQSDSSSLENESSNILSDYSSSENESSNILSGYGLVSDDTSSENDYTANNYFSSDISPT